MQASYLKDVLKRKTTLNDPESLYDGTNFWRSVSAEQGKRKQQRKEEERDEELINENETKNEAEANLKPAFKTLVLRVLIIIIYMCLGALVFCAIEYKREDKTIWKRKTNLMKSRMTEKYNITLIELEKFEEAIEKKLKENVDKHKEWNYYQSLYFASTVTTTIGYGHITPETQAGRLFLIVFALVGIPLNILALATVGEHITIGICYGISRLSRLCCKTRTVRHINIKVMIVSITLMVIMLFAGGALYVTTENWTYIDSIYYCFVALATIGFGDLVPNHGQAPKSSFEKSLWSLRVLYISIGLSLVSTVFTAISNAIEEINDLLGWPRKGNEDEEDHDRPSRRSSRKEPSFKSRSFRLPNEITYRTEEEELQEDLANALPFPSLRLGRQLSRQENNQLKIRNRSISKVEENDEYFEENRDVIERRNGTKFKMCNGNAKQRKESQSDLSTNSLNQPESTIDEDEDDTDKNAEKRYFDKTDEKADDRMDEKDNGISKGELITIKCESMSINSSENHGYESSHSTISENIRKMIITDKANRPDYDHAILDIESQISDFPHCTTKVRSRVYERKCNGFHYHPPQTNDYIITG
eukprot:gene6111-6815_t